MKKLQKRIDVFLNYFQCTARDLFATMPMEITCILLLNALSSIVAFGQVYVIADLFDEVEISSKAGIVHSDLFMYVVLFLLFLTIPQFLDIIKTYINDVKINEKNEVLRIKFYEATLSAPMLNFEESDFHNNLTRAIACINKKGLLNYFLGFVNCIPQIFKLIGVISVMTSFHTAFVWIAAISIVPSLISKILENRNLYDLRHRQTPVARRRDYLWGILTSPKTVKELRTSGCEEYIKTLWTNARDECLDGEFKMELKSANILMLCDLIKLSGVAVSIGLVVHLINQGNISVGQFSACIAAFSTLQSATGAIVTHWAGQDDKLNYVKDYYDFINSIEEKRNNNASLVIADKSNLRFELKNVRFKYLPDGSDVIKDISFDIQPGERVMIVGENGSGKTTLSKILIGMFHPYSGEILVNGINLCDLSKDELWACVSAVQQDYVCYSFSLRENIGLSSPDVKAISDDQRIKHYAELAGGDGIIDKIGLDEELGREFDGTALSGGEWQKIAVARALNKDSNFMILDEPTAAFDPIVETEVLRNFIDITEGKTSVIITHRVGICRYADKIIVMKSGKIVEQGDHNDLLKKGGEYARLWFEQAKWYNV